ncbi:MAG: hypothetical protein PHP85_10415 [Gallionella sp.]|nr:hypothetical protein [Gallionella sp.]
MEHPALQAAIWPDCPVSFDTNGLALILLTSGCRRQDARIQARVVLKEILGRLSPGAELVETPGGPTLAGSNITISLSYATDKVLIGLSCRHALGVDIVAIDHFPEIEALSRLYLPEAACLCVLVATPELRGSIFAKQWAQTEACCKALDLPLSEINAVRERAYAECELPPCRQINDYRIAVALVARKVAFRDPAWQTC